MASITGKAMADIDEWQTEMQLKPMRQGQVQLYTTGLAPQDRALTAVPVVDDLAAAVRASMDRTGDPAVAVIPDGPYVIPVVGG